MEGKKGKAYRQSVIGAYSSRIRKGSKFRYVSKWIDYKGRIYYRTDTHGSINHSYATELEAAKAVDIQLIQQGKEPVNILKRKT